MTDTLEDRIVLLETRVTLAEAKAMVAERAVELLAKKLAKYTDLTADEWNSLVVEMSKALLERAGQEPEEGRRRRFEIMAESYRGLTLAPEKESRQPLHVFDGGGANLDA
jgi:polyhydroxyalkanoate synthesis regulator phasin